MTHPPAQLLHLPHHDGSPTYVDAETAVLDGTVTVRMRTAGTDPVERVWLRTTYDAEPVFHACRPSTQGATTWWEAELPTHNPVTHYRFLLGYADGDQAWLTAAGLTRHDGPDAFDFKVSTHPAAPAWGRDGVVYQIFPDRFARSAAAELRPTPEWALPASWDDEVLFELSDPRTPVQLFGGDLDGVVDHLDHVARVGTTILYTTPVFPAESNHRYNASTFDAVDPLLGGDEGYERLSQAVHARGWRLLGDLTTNHTGDTHEWFLRAVADPEAPTRSWYYFDEDGGYATWMGFATLPKLDHTSEDLRRAMVDGPDSIVARWLRPPYSVDGWRIDVANMTGRHGAVDVTRDVARAVRRTAEAERPDALVIGEHNHDASADLDGDGWHGTMNYSGFSWPVWSWLRAEDTPARAFGRPALMPRRGGPAVRQALGEWIGRYGWRAFSTSWNILGSHDSARIRTVVGSGTAHRVAAGLQFTLPGVPMIFAGDEIGLEGLVGEDSRRPMPWHRPERWDSDTLAAYIALGAARRDHVALRRGGLRWAHVDEDTLVFLREHPEGSLLVAARRADGPAVDLPADLLGAAAAQPVLATEGEAAPLEADGHTLTVPAAGAGLAIWRLA